MDIDIDVGMGIGHGHGHGDGVEMEMEMAGANLSDIYSHYRQRSHPARNLLIGHDCHNYPLLS